MFKMKRLVLLGTLIATGSVAIVGFQAPPAGPTAASLAATRIEKVKDNLYVITGSSVEDTNLFSGGNTAVFITDAGVVVVDSKLPGWGPTVMDRIKSVTNKPITTIINTHSHSDHNGGNEFFGATVDTVVQENTKANMVRMDEFKGDKAKFLPKRTYKDKLTLGAGKDRVDLYYFGRGHTDGDTFVVFPALQTMHTGDMFAWKALPYIDPDNGGSVLLQPDALAKAIASIKNVDTVITGHTPVLKWAELKEYAEFTKDFVEWGKKQLKAGKTVDQAAAEYKVPPKFVGYKAIENPQWGGPRPNLEILYNELRKK